MCSPYNKLTRHRKASKRKADTKALDSSKSDPSFPAKPSDPSQCIWSTYKDIYDIIAINPPEVQTTEECVANSRVIDVTTTKLIYDVQRLDLNSIDVWVDIAERLVVGWNKFFYGPENIDDWSIGNLIPLNRYKSNYFSLSKSFLEKVNHPEHRLVASQKKQLTKRKDDNPHTKVAKPIQGFVEDKPPLLIEHMGRIKSVLNKMCTNRDDSIPYMKLVLHPTSFSNTVYNIFAVAFLVREGMVTFSIGSDDEPVVKPLPNFFPPSYANDNGKKCNFLVSLTTAEWKMLVKKLGITNPLVPSPEGFDEKDEFFEKFTLSQKERRKEKK